MKKRLTRGEKWLFAAPLLFVAVAALAWQRQQSGPLTLPLPDKSYATILEYSPDGKRLLVCFQDSKTLLYTSRVYDLTTRSVVCELATPPSLDTSKHNRRTIDYFYRWMAWSNDGESIAASSSYLLINKIAIWDARSGAIKADYPKLPREGGYSDSEGFHFSPDDKTLVNGGVPPMIYDVATGTSLGKPSQFNADLKGENSSVVTSENFGVYTTFDTRTRSFRVMDSKTKRVVWEPKITLSPFFKWSGEVLCVRDSIPVALAKRAGNNRILLWNGRTRKLLPSPPTVAGANIGEFCFTPDGRSLVYYHAPDKSNQSRKMGERNRGELVAFDYQSNRVLWRTATDGELSRFQFSPDGKKLVAMADHSSTPPVYVFDQTGKQRFERQTPNYVARWSPDSAQLASVVGEVDEVGRPLTSCIEIERLED